MADSRRKDLNVIAHLANPFELDRQHALSSTAPRRPRTGIRSLGTPRADQAEHGGIFADGHHDLASPVPVQHGGQSAGPAPLIDVDLPLLRGDRAMSTCFEAFVEKASKPMASILSLHAQVAERAHILGGGTLSLILDQAFLENQRVRRIDDRETADPGIAAQGSRPGNRAAQSWPTSANRSMPSASASANMSAINLSVAYPRHPAAGRCRRSP